MQDLLSLEVFVMSILFNPFTPISSPLQYIDFTLSNATRFYSPKGNPSGLKGLIQLILSIFYNYGKKIN